MQNFNLITAIVSDISEAEKKVLLRIIRGQSKRADILAKMFDLLINKKCNDFTQLKIKLYGRDDKLTTDAFRKSCDRFLEIVFEAISHLDTYLENRHLYSDVFFNRKLVGEKVRLFYSLRLKKIPPETVLKLILPAEKLCKTYEFLEEFVLIKNELINVYYNLNRRSDIERCQKEMLGATSMLRDFRISEVYVFKYINLVQHLSIDDKSMISDLRNAIEHLEVLLKDSPLKGIEYNLLMLKLQYFHFTERFVEAEKIMYEIIKLTNENLCVKFFGRITMNYMNLSYTQLFLGKYQEAYENGILASKVIYNTITTVNLNRESAIFPLIYLNKLKEADELLEDILSSGYIGNGVEEFSKRKLMHAFVKYLLGDYKAAFVLLQDTKESESDKEGWNLGVRMMNIYLTLSTDKVDLADQRIGSMRKHIERTSKMRNLRKRDVIIFRILSHLSRSGFDFKETWEDRQKDFDLLRNGGGDYRWIPRSHELIIFDQWFEAKMLGKPYQPVFPKPPETVEK